MLNLSPDTCHFSSIHFPYEIFSKANPLSPNWNKNVAKIQTFLPWWTVLMAETSNYLLEFQNLDNTKFTMDYPILPQNLDLL